MDLEPQDIDQDKLERLPYTELRKLASKFGIQRMKAEKLVFAIMDKVSSTEDDCFSTPAAKLMNSSKKNKEKIFDENHKTPLATPRRGTFTVETPSFVIAGDALASLEDSASVLDESNVTFSRGSERKLRSRKVSFMSPTLTPRTPRSQSLRNRPKTPVAARTPLNESNVLNFSSVEPKRKSDESLLDSPETKIAKKTEESDVKKEDIGKNFSTPLPSSVRKSGKKARLSRAKISPKNIGVDKTENAGKNISTPLPSSVQKSEKRVRLTRANVSFKDVEDVKAISPMVISSTPLPVKAQKVENSANISSTKISLNADKSDTNTQSAIKEPTSQKKKQTPNFKRIHQKAFEKMESIDDYQKRKMLNSAKKLAQQSKLKSKVTKAKSKIPAFSGIPFISAQNKSKPLVKSSGSRIMSISAGNKAPPKSKENVFKPATPLARSIDKKRQNLPKTPLSTKAKLETSLRKKGTPMSAKSKAKFDLRQSLSRKLNYKPHRGPLKPLAAVNTTTLHSTSVLQPKEPVESKVVTKNRSQNRSMIRGVRMNKRFELQMKNRKMN